MVKIKGQEIEGPVIVHTVEEIEIWMKKQTDFLKDGSQL